MSDDHRIASEQGVRGIFLRTTPLRRHNSNITRCICYKRVSGSEQTRGHRYSYSYGEVIEGKWLGMEASDGELGILDALRIGGILAYDFDDSSIPNRAHNY